MYVTYVMYISPLIIIITSVVRFLTEQLVRYSSQQRTTQLETIIMWGERTINDQSLVLLFD